MIKVMFEPSLRHLSRSSFCFLLRDIATFATNHEPIRNSTDNDHHHNRIIPTLTVTPVDATTARIQTLRQRLFSTPL
ncbi:unnamed protein product, partial [Rotaria sp. Silwood1]